MKWSLIVLSIALSLQGFGATPKRPNKIAVSTIRGIPFSNTDIQQQGFKPSPRRNLRFHEKKGTIGIMLPILLGPIGYLAILAFSHDETVTKKAKKGIRIWTGMIVLLGILFLGVVLKSPPAPDFLDTIIQSFLFSA